MATIAFTVVLFAVFVCGESAVRQSRLTPELTRRFIHCASGIVVAFMPYSMTFLQIRWLAVFFVAFMFVSRRTGMFSSIHSVERQTFGEVYFPLGIFLASFVEQPACFSAGALVLAISDPLAAQVGTRWPIRKFRYKSLGGSAAFLISSFLIVGSVATVSDQLSATLGFVAVISAIVTIEELILGLGLDNIVIAGTVAYLMNQMLR